MSDIEKALQLMGIGMFTVFIILLLVVLIGILIIRIVNNYIPESKEKVATTIGVEPKLSAGKMAAIVAAVQIVTNGTGKVVQVEKKKK